MCIFTYLPEDAEHMSIYESFFVLYKIFERLNLCTKFMPDNIHYIKIYYNICMNTSNSEKGQAVKATMCTCMNLIGQLVVKHLMNEVVMVTHE